MSIAITFNIDAKGAYDGEKSQTFNLGDMTYTVNVTGIPEDREAEVSKLLNERWDSRNAREDMEYFRAEAERLRTELLAVRAEYAAFRAKHDPELATLRVEMKAFLKDNPHAFIQGIKAVREKSGMGLKEAKDFMDSVRAELNAEVTV